MVDKSPTAAMLWELYNLIALMPADNPQAMKYETRKVRLGTKEAAKVLPRIPYADFSEVISKLDQNGDSFEAYMGRQVSTLYFLLRLSVVATVKPKRGASKRLAVLEEEDSPQEPDELFPPGLLENTPQHTSLQLLANYLTEDWNRYTTTGPTRNQHEATGRSRLYLLVAEVIRAYGAWAWPFFYHHESSDHVDHMLRLVEESNGRLPLKTGTY